MGTTKTRRTRAPLTDAEREAKRAAERQLLKDAVQRLQQSDGWLAWLKTRRHFRAYSLRNQLLIALQNPDATRVCSFRAWLKLGYAVRKGERGIRIFAPVPPSKAKLAEWEAAGCPSNAKPRTFFRLTSVFDVAQVDPVSDFPGGPTPLEPPRRPVNDDGAEQLLAPLLALADELGCPVAFAPVFGAASGYFVPATREIVVDEQLTPGARVRTLTHELCHALVRVEAREGDPVLDYAAEELVVEASTFLALGASGLDTAGVSETYLASWAEQAPLEVLDAAAQLSDRIARRIETTLTDPADTAEVGEGSA